MLKTWSIVSLISMCDTELADNRNQMDLKIHPHQAYFFQNIRCSILPPCSILPRFTIYTCVAPVNVVTYHKCINFSHWYIYGNLLHLRATHTCKVILYIPACTKNIVTPIFSCARSGLLRRLYFHNGHSHTGKTSLYWNIDHHYVKNHGSLSPPPPDFHFRWACRPAKMSFVSINSKLNLCSAGCMQSIVYSHSDID